MIKIDCGKLIKKRMDEYTASIIVSYCDITKIPLMKLVSINFYNAIKVVYKNHLIIYINNDSYAIMRKGAYLMYLIDTRNNLRLTIDLAASATIGNNDNSVIRISLMRDIKCKNEQQDVYEYKRDLTIKRILNYVSSINSLEYIKTTAPITIDSPIKRLHYSFSIGYNELYISVTMSSVYKRPVYTISSTMPMH